MADGRIWGVVVKRREKVETSRDEMWNDASREKEEIIGWMNEWMKKEEERSGEKRTKSNID